MTGRAGYHQDYIARIRHSNALPPPPLPPKLLHIPNIGLVDGPYTAGNYAARLAREQPLNVDADAFGGMEINLVGLKGAFEGNEPSLHFDDNLPPIDPADRPLLRPLEMIGKPTTISSGVTFLRRTEYIAQQKKAEAAAAAAAAAASSAALRAPPSRPKPRLEVKNDDPINILRSIVKGFDIAYPNDAYTGADSQTNLKGHTATNAEKQSWAKPRHPNRRDVTLLDAYPLLPDLDAIPEEGGYFFYRFQHHPGAAEDKDDETVHVSLLRPLNEGTRFELFVPEQADSVEAIKRKFDVMDQEAAEDDDLYDNVDEDGTHSFRYKRVRVYLDERVDASANKFGNSVALALHDPQGPEDRLRKGAYMYPLSGRGRLIAERPKTSKIAGYPPGAGVDGAGSAVDDPEKVDVVLVTVSDPPEAVRAKIDAHRAGYDPLPEE